MKQSYFLGGTSPSGFRTDFLDQIKKHDYFTYILKGGPGTGKSTLMKKIAASCDDESCETYFCSSDIHSLDAVVLTEKKIIVVDGTAPHVFDPLLPGVSQEIINLGDFWNKKKLTAHRETIRYCSDENSRYHNRAARYLKAAGTLCSSIMYTSENSLIKNKLDSFADRMASRILKGFKPDRYKTPEYKQLSAFTSFGYLTRDIPDYYRIYSLNDDYFAGSDRFIRKISQHISEYGITAIISKCNAFEETVYEHLLIPELKLAFMSSDFLNRNKYENSSDINFTRFYDHSILSKKKNRLSFDKKIISEIVDSASEEINTALTVHNELEKYFIESLEINKIEKFSENFIKKIL
ncbi:MAG: ATPase [Oscillospiraceae bacterium]|nr:ATPase [Oscillospiraceae bacterium]